MSDVGLFGIRCLNIIDLLMDAIVSTSCQYSFIDLDYSGMIAGDCIMDTPE
jgi:hypothetical protein